MLDTNKTFLIFIPIVDIILAAIPTDNEYLKMFSFLFMNLNNYILIKKFM